MSALALLVALATPVGAGGAQDFPGLLPAEPELWVEVPDMDRLSTELAGTSLGRLVGLVTSEIDPGEIALRLELPEQALSAVAEGGAREVVRGLALELGLSAERADALVASLAGGLVLARAPPDPGATELAGLVLAATLRPGGSLLLAEDVLQALEPADPAPRRAGGLQLLQLAREERECRAVWSWSGLPQLPSGFVVVRPGLLALCFERDLAVRLLDPVPLGVGPGGALGLARAASRERGELVLVRIVGQRLARASADPQARAILGALGVGELAGLELGLSTRGGQLASRLRLTRRERPAATREDEQRAREPVTWRSLDVLSTDALAVLGVARSPWETAELVAALAGSAQDRETAAFLERLGRAPLFGALRAQGALRRETLVFARAAGPGIPMLYAATPATPAIDKGFEVLGRRGASDVPLGKGLLLRRRPLSDGEAWILYADERGSPRSVFALTRVADTWIGSDVSAQLQSLLRQRSRERLAARAEAVRRLRVAIAEEVAAAGCAPSAVVAFLHVRAPALTELLWPYAQLALQVTGALEDPEALPDPLELAETVGDTTLVVLELGDGVEVRGRGLLGGLTVLF